MKICNALFVVALIFSIHTYASLPIVPLEGEQVYLRQVELSDTHAFAAIALDPQVLSMTGLFPPLKTIEDVEGFVRGYLIGDTNAGIMPRYPKAWAVVEKQSGNVIGLVVFVAYLERHQKAEIAYAFVPAYWNHGYATQACQAVARYAFGCGLVRLYATVDPANKASERVLQKLNMTCEGLMRAYMIVNGKRVDRKMYALIAKG